jgi:hypothetical protein
VHHAARVHRVAQPGKEHDELVATDSGHGVAGADGREDARRGLHQQAVAGGVAERVVDDLEAVQVQEEDAHPLARARRVRQHHGQPVQQETAVGKPGECVVVGKVLRAAGGAERPGALLLQQARHHPESDHPLQEEVEHSHVGGVGGVAAGPQRVRRQAEVVELLGRRRARAQA